MRKFITIALLAAVLGGCASTPQEPAPPIQTPAKCFSKEQCDAMWSEALVQLQNLSGMKLQVATDSFAQTYNGRGAGRMTASAQRIPIPGGGAVIGASFHCRYNCDHLNVAAVNLFGSRLKVVGARFGLPVE